jgi:transposase, IS5 family
LFLKELEKLGLVVNEGRIIERERRPFGFIEMPKQRNSREENKQIKSGEIPDKFSDSPNKLVCQINSNGKNKYLIMR